ALVLWALGWSMILMGVLVHVRTRVLLPVAICVIAGHNLLDGIRPDQLGALAGLWRVLHVAGFAIPGVLFVGYPLVPWVAVMVLGFALAPIFSWDADRRRRTLLWCGGAAFVLFVAARWLNGYGDPGPWTVQRTPILTVASFLNVRKYPPSLDFLLMTLGPALMALALAERTRLRGLAGWLATYGRVPLFFYVTHIFVAHAVAVILAFVQGGAPRRIQVVTNPGSIPDWYGVPLPGVYLLWAAVVLILFYPCSWLGRLKRTRDHWWLRYV
ncbi:MAG: DUF1624 domain-containing protein, partial [Vicinamibacterales bacterium]